MPRATRRSNRAAVVADSDGSDGDDSLIAQKPRKSSLLKPRRISDHDSFHDDTTVNHTIDNTLDADETITTPSKIQVLGLERVKVEKSQDQENRDVNTPSKVPVDPSTPQKQPLTDITQDGNINQMTNKLQRVKLDSVMQPDLGLYPIENTPLQMQKSKSGRTSLVQSPTKQHLVADSPPPPKQRLVISKLVLNNFKSYAGRQEIGPFHSSFSAVVGPNGSGKSNVIDSLLFVFGFRASKMRHSKISSLIHASSAMPNLTSCSVEVHFQDVKDNDDGTTTEVPDTQLVVSRKAFKNNSSKYFINERESNFTEVTTLLKDRGIDLDHKRFLILQGEVESIAQMKAKAENENDDGLLEYLEDIIGTSDYKKSIEDAQLQVESLNEDCVEKTNRLGIVEKELASLEGQKEEIIQFLDLENELTLKRSALLQLYRHLCITRMELSTKIVQENQDKLKQELEKTQENKGLVDELSTQTKQQAKELDQLKKKSAEAAKRLSKLEVSKVQIDEKKKHVETKRKKLEKTIATATHLRTEAQSWLDDYAEESSSLTAEVDALTKSLKIEAAKLEAIQDELKDKTQVFADEIEETQRLLEPWRQKISAKESEIAVAQSQVQLLNERSEATQEALNAAQAKISSIRVKGRDKKKELGTLQEKLQYTSEQVRLGEGEIKQASEGYENMKSKLSSMRQKLAAAKESQHAVQSQNKVLRGLTKLSNSGRIEGFHGRLGALGTIDQKFDVAISTACPSLDNIVVESVETGQQCVEYLRKNNLGRAKFILLNQLPKRDISKIQTPENVPRLVDLIQPKDPKFLPAFYSVLSDTLVAADPEQARRIAYGKKRWRVVTLGGMLVDIAGTMSGGGSSVRSGAMKDKLTQDVSEESVKEMEDYLGKYELKVSHATKEFEKMETALQGFKEEIPAIELDISKYQMELQSLEKELKVSESGYLEVEKEQNASQGSLKKDIQEATRLVKNREDELAELKSHTQEMEEKIAQLQEKIMEAGGVRLRMQKSTVDGIKEKMELCNTKLSNGVLERTKSTNEVKKQTRAIDSAAKEIADSESEFEQFGSQLSEINSQITVLEKECSLLNDTVVDKQEALDTLKEELDDRQRQIDDVRSVEIEIQNTIAQHVKSLKDDAASRENHEAQLRELFLHNVAELKALGKRKAVKQGTPLSTPKKGKVENDDSDVEEGREEHDEMQVDEDNADDDDEEEEDDEPAPHLTEFSNDELAGFNKESLKKSIAKLEEQTADAKIDMQVLKDYRRRVQEYETRRGTLNDAVTERDDVKKRCDDLRQRRLDEFMTGFNIISLKLKEMYQMITMGGNAELELVDSLDPFSEGIIFSVMPPKKSWRNISNLSGGEKTLSSLALVFALHHYKPTPLYVMDEIDAALDFRNVSIVATYINERTKNGQFIVISLRNNMFELAQQLVGIYKVNNMTRSVAMQNRPLITPS